MKKVIEIYINDDNMPVFVTETGQSYKAHNHPTGNCWVMTFEEVEHDPTPELEVFEIDGINVRNSLLVGEKILKRNGFVDQTAHEAMEALRPLFIRLDRHKELIRKVYNDSSKEMTDSV
jgi:hypothetical protein